MKLRTIFCLGIFALGLLAGPALAGEENNPQIQEQAAELIKKTCQFLRSQKEFAYHLETFETVLDENGMFIQYSHGVDVAVRRPNMLRKHSEGDLRNHTLYYDGHKITLAENSGEVYGEIDAPGTIDEAFDFAQAKYGITLPLVSLVYNEPCRAISDDIISGQYLGEGYVSGLKCHHLAFRQKGLDWQIWIEDNGTMTVPRKVVIINRNTPDSPEYMALISGWNFNPKLPEGLFTFKPDQGAVQVEVRPRQDAK